MDANDRVSGLVDARLKNSKISPKCLGLRKSFKVTYVTYVITNGKTSIIERCKTVTANYPFQIDNTISDTYNERNYIFAVKVLVIQTGVQRKRGKFN